MTTPSSIPPTVLPPQVTNVSPEVIAAATRVVRTKMFLKKTFKNVGTPVIAGAVGGLVAIRAARKQDSDDANTVDTPTE